MKNETKSRIAAGVLVGTIFLSGCGKKSDCEVPSRHVHRYTKEVSEDVILEKYVESEYIRLHGYDWNNEYIEINNHDAEMYNLLNKNMLFDGITNWDYLYNVMKNNHDYLMFYYEYYTTETYTTTDGKGHTQTHTRLVHHDGWHRSATDSDNTGLVRLYHHRYYGYRVTYDNGKYKLEKSPIVDDIRDIVESYPYFSEDPVHEVYEQFRFNKSELKNLNPDDFDVFDHPDLTQKQLILK